MAADTVVEISNVWKIFGARAEEALRAVRDRELSKAQVLSEFNAVVGVADVSLSVNRGEIFCIMGLVWQRQIYIGPPLSIACLNLPMARSRSKASTSWPWARVSYSASATKRSVWSSRISR